MKLLFLSYHYLGPFEPLARWLAAQGNEILVASIRSTRVENDNIPGLRRVIIKHFSPLADHSFTNILANVAKSARNALDSLSTIRSNNFEPEIIFTFSSDGSALAIPDAFPNALWINFLESNPDARQRSIQCLQILKANQTFAFQPSQKACFPKVLLPLIKLIKPMVDIEFFSPPLARKEQRLAVFCCRKENVVSAIASKFLASSEHGKAMIIASNIPSLRRLNSQFNNIDRVRVTLAGTRQERRELFRTGNIAFFDYPCFMLIESMACGCPTFASPDIPEPDRPDNVPVHAGCELPSLLNNPKTLDECSQILRETAVAQYNLQEFMPVWFNSILQNFIP